MNTYTSTFEVWRVTILNGNNFLFSLAEHFVSESWPESRCNVRLLRPAYTYAWLHWRRIIPGSVWSCLYETCASRKKGADDKEWKNWVIKQTGNRQYSSCIWIINNLCLCDHVIICLTTSVRSKFYINQPFIVLRSLHVMYLFSHQFLKNFKTVMYLFFFS